MKKGLAHVGILVFIFVILLIVIYLYNTEKRLSPIYPAEDPFGDGGGEIAEDSSGIGACYVIGFNLTEIDGKIKCIADYTVLETCKKLAENYNDPEYDIAQGWRFYEFKAGENCP